MLTAPSLSAGHQGATTVSPGPVCAACSVASTTARLTCCSGVSLVNSIPLS